MKRPRDISISSTTDNEIRPFKKHKVIEKSPSSPATTSEQTSDKGTKASNTHLPNAPSKEKDRLGHDSETPGFSNISRKRQEIIQQFALADYFSKQRSQQMIRNNENGINIGNFAHAPAVNNSTTPVKHSSNTTDIDRIHANITRDIYSSGP